MNKVSKIALFLILGCIAVAGLLKTNHIQHIHGFTDMRNRVVGARLMKDGQLPYYYHWYQGDTLRYMVERMADTGRTRHVSMMTASPFFHRIMVPVADYNESTLERALFIICYMMLIAMAVIAWYKSKNLLLTLVFFVPFLFTDAWWHHILQSQYYICFAFLLFVISLCLYKNKYVWAGILFAFLVLLRLNCLVFLIPFLLYFKRYKTFLLTTIISMMVYVVVVACMPFEKANWIEYFSAIKEHTAVHMGKLPNAKESLDMNAILPRVFEGDNLMEMDSIRHAEGFWVNPTATNFKGLYGRIFGYEHFSLRLFQFFFGISVLLMSFFVVRKVRKLKTFEEAVPSLVYTGFLFYFFSNFFSPIDNAPYEMAQWMALISLFIIQYKDLPKSVFACMILGILINISYIPALPLKHMASEFLFMIGCIIAILSHRKSFDDTANSES